MRFAASHRPAALWKSVPSMRSAINAFDVRADFIARGDALSRGSFRIFFVFALSSRCELRARDGTRTPRGPPGLIFVFFGKPRWDF